MLRGFATVSYYAADLDAAAAWYAEVLGIMYNQHYLDVLAERAVVD